MLDTFTRSVLPQLLHCYSDLRVRDLEFGQWSALEPNALCLSWTYSSCFYLILKVSGGALALSLFLLFTNHAPISYTELFRVDVKLFIPIVKLLKWQRLWWSVDVDIDLLNHAEIPLEYLRSTRKPLVGAFSLYFQL